MHGVDCSRVVIFSNRGIEHSIFAADKKAGSFTVVPIGEGARTGTVRFRTIQQFKGLEADAVVLMHHNRPDDRDERQQSKELLYVGNTRTAKECGYTAL
ncbi:MAG: ATP-binding domain-containing protein [Spirochaetes bacterium]|jgi:superfamily I DNA/RNA helicase|nr:ATP-binding domain-containing protein [Spirochaetota bacterium]